MIALTSILATTRQIALYVTLSSFTCLIILVLIGLIFGGRKNNNPDEYTGTSSKNKPQGGVDTYDYVAPLHHYDLGDGSGFIDCGSDCGDGC